MAQRSYLSAALLLLVSPSIYADDETLAPIIVTATRTAQTADEALASVTVITRDDIERQQVVSVVDLLRGTPGLSIDNNGGLGKATSVFLRGTNSDQVLVLIDGVKVGSPTLGTTPFENIPMDQIERIEIVRGPRSSLYGSEAIGGVIQIFTRKGGGATTPSLSLGGGSHNTYTAAAGISGGGPKGWYNVSTSGIRTDGFNACRGTPSGGGCFTFEPDNDGYDSGSGALRAGYRFDGGTQVDLHALRTTGSNQYDGTFSNEARIRQQVLGARVGFSPLTWWRATLAAGNSQDDSSDYLNGVFVDRFNSRRDTASFQNDITLGASHLFTVGVDYQNDHVDSDTVYAVTERRNTGVFGQYQGAFGKQDVQLAARRDDNEQFGEHSTGGVAWGYGLGRDLRFFASYGTAFKAPTFNQLYYPFFSNPNLRPEESRSYELGIRGQAGVARWSISTYDTNIEDLIVFDATFTPINIDTARIRGVETTVRAQWAGWNVATALTLLDPENRSEGRFQGNTLPRRAKESVRFDLDRIIGKLRIGTTLFGEGRRFDDIANTVPLSGYATVDLRAEVALSSHWLLGGRIGNVLDKHYETAAFFNQDGRNYFLTLRLISPK